MRHVKLFEQFLNESKLEDFYNKMVKNPRSGREVKVSTILNDEDLEDEPIYQKLQAMEQKLKEGGEGQIKALEDKIESIQMDIRMGEIDGAEGQDQIDQLRKKIKELKNKG